MEEQDHCKLINDNCNQIGGKKELDEALVDSYKNLLLRLSRAQLRIDQLALKNELQEETIKNWRPALREAILSRREACRWSSSPAPKDYHDSLSLPSPKQHQLTFSGSREESILSDDDYYYTTPTRDRNVVQKNMSCEISSSTSPHFSYLAENVCSENSPVEDGRGEDVKHRRRGLTKYRIPLPPSRRMTTPLQKCQEFLENSDFTQFSPVSPARKLFLTRSNDSLLLSRKPLGSVTEEDGVGGIKGSEDPVKSIGSWQMNYDIISIMLSIKSFEEKINAIQNEFDIDDFLGLKKHIVLDSEPVTNVFVDTSGSTPTKRAEVVKNKMGIFMERWNALKKEWFTFQERVIAQTQKRVPPQTYPCGSNKGKESRRLLQSSPGSISAFELSSKFRGPGKIDLATISHGNEDRYSCRSNSSLKMKSEIFITGSSSEEGDEDSNDGDSLIAGNFSTTTTNENSADPDDVATLTRQFVRNEIARLESKITGIDATIRCLTTVNQRPCDSSGHQHAVDHRPSGSITRTREMVNLPKATITSDKNCQTALDIDQQITTDYDEYKEYNLHHNHHPFNLTTSATDATFVSTRYPTISNTATAVTADVVPTTTTISRSRDNEEGAFETLIDSTNLGSSGKMAPLPIPQTPTPPITLIEPKLRLNLLLDSPVSRVQLPPKRDKTYDHYLLPTTTITKISENNTTLNNAAMLPDSFTESFDSQTSSVVTVIENYHLKEKMIEPQGMLQNSRENNSFPVSISATGLLSSPNRSKAIQRSYAVTHCHINNSNTLSPPRAMIESTTLIGSKTPDILTANTKITSSFIQSQPSTSILYSADSMSGGKGLFHSHVVNSFNTSSARTVSTPASIKLMQTQIHFGNTQSLITNQDKTTTPINNSHIKQSKDRSNRLLSIQSIDSGIYGGSSLSKIFPCLGIGGNGIPSVVSSPTPMISLFSPPTYQSSHSHSSYCFCPDYYCRHEKIATTPDYLNTLEAAHTAVNEGDLYPSVVDQGDGQKDFYKSTLLSGDRSTSNPLKSAKPFNHRYTLCSFHPTTDENGDGFHNLKHSCLSPRGLNNSALEDLDGTKIKWNTSMSKLVEGTSVIFPECPYCFNKYLLSTSETNKAKNCKCRYSYKSQKNNFSNSGTVTGETSPACKDCSCSRCQHCRNCQLQDGVEHYSENEKDNNYLYYYYYYVQYLAHKKELKKSTGKYAKHLVATNMIILKSIIQNLKHRINKAARNSNSCQLSTFPTSSLATSFTTCKCHHELDNLEGVDDDLNGQDLTRRNDTCYCSSCQLLKTTPMSCLDDGTKNIRLLKHHEHDNEHELQKHFLNSLTRRGSGHHLSTTKRNAAPPPCSSVKCCCPSTTRGGPEKSICCYCNGYKKIRAPKGRKYHSNVSLTLPTNEEQNVYKAFCPTTNPNCEFCKVPSGTCLLPSSPNKRYSLLIKKKSGSSFLPPRGSLSNTEFQTSKVPGPEYCIKLQKVVPEVRRGNIVLPPSLLPNAKKLAALMNETTTAMRHFKSFSEDVNDSRTRANPFLELGTVTSRTRYTDKEGISIGPARSLKRNHRNFDKYIVNEYPSNNNNIDIPSRQKAAPNDNFSRALSLTESKVVDVSAKNTRDESFNKTIPDQIDTLRNHHQEDSYVRNRNRSWHRDIKSCDKKRLEQFHAQESEEGTASNSTKFVPEISISSSQDYDDTENIQGKEERSKSVHEKGSRNKSHRLRKFWNHLLARK